MITLLVGMAASFESKRNPRHRLTPKLLRSHKKRWASVGPCTTRHQREAHRRGCLIACFAVAVETVQHEPILVELRCWLLLVTPSTDLQHDRTKSVVRFVDVDNRAACACKALHTLVRRIGLVQAAVCCFPSKPQSHAIWPTLVAAMRCSMGGSAACRRWLLEAKHSLQLLYRPSGLVRFR